jgi:transposase
VPFAFLLTEQSMAAPRKNPPKDALADIERLAGKGYSTVGLAKHFNVARSVVMRWFEENQSFEEAYEQGRDSYRQALEEQIVSMTLAGKNPAGFIYLLKAKYKMYDQASSSTKVDVAVNAPQAVMLVTDHGTDAQWAAKVAEQQRKLTQGDAQASFPRLPAPQEASETSAEPVGFPESVPAYIRPSAPIYAPSWKGRS